MVSPKRSSALAKIGIESVRDLVSNYPRRYVDMSYVSTIAAAQIGMTCTIRARVYEVKLKKPRPNLPLAEVTVTDETGTLIVTAFRQPWLADQLKHGMPIALSGKVEFNYGFKRMVNPYIEALEGDGEGFHGMILPVHPSTGSVKAGMMRRLVSNALELVQGAHDPLPLSLRARYRLMSRSRRSILHTLPPHHGRAESGATAPGLRRGAFAAARAHAKRRGSQRGEDAGFACRGRPAHLSACCCAPG